MGYLAFGRRIRDWLLALYMTDHVGKQAIFNLLERYLCFTSSHSVWGQSSLLFSSLPWSTKARQSCVDLSMPLLSFTDCS
jgi:hypothetical protein